MPSDKGFLVTVKVYLLGGEQVVLTDAFRAESEDEARNFALNTFIRGEGAVWYGKGFVVLDAVCAVVYEHAEIIDLALAENEKYLDTIDLFERMMDEEQEGDRPRPVTSGFGRDEPQYGG